MAMSVWSAVYPPVLYLAISFVVELGMGVVMMMGYIAQNNISMAELTTEAVMNDFLEQFLEASMMMTLISALVACLIFFPLMYLDRRRRKLEGYVEPEVTATPVMTLLIIPLGAAACMGFNHLVGLLPASVSESYDQTAQLIYSAPYPVMILSVVIFAPIAEELIFRGLVFARFREIMSFPAACVLSALYFGIFHMNMVQFIYASCLGVIMAFVYEKYRSIWATVLLHVSANAVSVLVTFIPVYNVSTWGAYFLLMFAELAVTALILFVMNRKLKTGDESTANA